MSSKRNLNESGLPAHKRCSYGSDVCATLPNDMLVEILSRLLVPALYTSPHLLRANSTDDEMPGSAVVLRTCRRFWTIRASIWRHALRCIPAESVCHTHDVPFTRATRFQVRALFEDAFLRGANIEDLSLVTKCAVSPRDGSGAFTNATLLKNIIAVHSEQIGPCIDQAMLTTNAEALDVVIACHAAAPTAKPLSEIIGSARVSEILGMYEGNLTAEEVLRKKAIINTLLRVCRPIGADLLNMALARGCETDCLMVLHHYPSVESYHLSNACAAGMHHLVRAMLETETGKSLCRQRGLLQAVENDHPKVVIELLADKMTTPAEILLARAAELCHEECWRVLDEYWRVMLESLERSRVS